MKHFISLYFIFFVISAYTQGLTDSYINSGIAYGIRPIAPQLSMVDFSINNNGAVETYTHEVPNDLTARGLNIFLGFGRYEGLSHQIFFDLPLGEPKSSKFGYNLGYNLAFELGRQDVLLRPSLGIATGEGSYALTEQNYSLETPLVFDTLTLMEPVTYKVKRNVITVNPGLEISYLINQKYALQFQVHYDIEITNKALSLDIVAASLEGPNPNYEFNENLTLTYMGETLSSRLIDYSGLRFSIGISSYINRQLFN